MLRISEALADVQYVTNGAGDRTNVIVPLSAWESLLSLLEEMVARLEDREDLALLEEWLHARAAGTADMISLDQLEEELRNDGLLPG
jgi:hypothetical protein